MSWLGNIAYRREEEEPVLDGGGGRDELVSSGVHQVLSLFVHQIGCLSSSGGSFNTSQDCFLTSQQQI